VIDWADGRGTVRGAGVVHGANGGSAARAGVQGRWQGPLCSKCWHGEGGQGGRCGQARSPIGGRAHMKPAHHAKVACPTVAPNMYTCVDNVCAAAEPQPPHAARGQLLPAGGS